MDLLNYFGADEVGRVWTEEVPAWPKQQSEPSNKGANDMADKPIPKPTCDMPVGEPGPRSLPSKDDIYDALDSITDDAPLGTRATGCRSAPGSGAVWPKKPSI